MNTNNFLNKLITELYEAEEEQQVSKNLAKEDALTLIAEFVKDVKKKFSKKSDRTEILQAAKKTLDFFINEIDNDNDNDDDVSFPSMDAKDETGQGFDDDDNDVVDVDF